MQDRVTIGILGKPRRLFWDEKSDSSSSALQGAFAEHEAALRKISSPVKVCPLLVRTPDDLVKCDGLVIPGGGECHVVWSMSSFLTLCRVDNDRSSSQPCRTPAAAERIHQDKTDLGYLCRRDPLGTDCRESQKGWTRAVEWDEYHCRAQRLGFPGSSG